MTEHQIHTRPLWRDRRVWLVSALGAVAVGGMTFWMSGHLGTTRSDLSLSGLIANPYEDQEHVHTPEEVMRNEFESVIGPEPGYDGRPEASGTVLVLRAISEFNERQRRIAIDDAVRHLRKNPDAQDAVWALVATYRRNNPHMAEHVEEVKERIFDKLSRPPVRALEWLNF